MRIAVINWSRRRVGGVESYLANVVPELTKIGHTVAFWCETDKPISREEIPLPDAVASWSVHKSGAGDALKALREWNPDLLYIHKLSNPEIEAKVLQIAPAVFFFHDYYGACISGNKTFKNPVLIPCKRKFGWQCLLHYYPHRCGGWSPITMLKMYRLQSARLKLLHRYHAVVTHSDHMRSELIKNGLVPDRVYNVSCYALRGDNEIPYSKNFSKQPHNHSAASSEPRQNRKNSYHLLFLGRMDFLKGGSIFLEALPQVSASLRQPLRVTFAGDGPDRQKWQRQADRLQSRACRIRVEFVGWVGHHQLDSLWATSDLLVMPSVWPEPFGLVGLEAGLHGVPTVAFGVGGIPTWLMNGVNGCLASGDPPSPTGLAETMIKALTDGRTHARLRQGAFEISQQFSKENHLSNLMKVFEKVAADSFAWE